MTGKMGKYMLKKGFKGIRVFINLFCLGVLLLTGPCLAGFKMYAVVSGSMEPKIPVGAAVYVRRKAFSEIHTGDVITFLTKNRKMTVTHRVVAVNREEKTFVTKGDANPEKDGNETCFDQVQGVVTGVVPLAGYLLLFLKNRFVRAWIVLAFIFPVLIKMMIQKEKTDVRACREKGDFEQ